MSSSANKQRNASDMFSLVEHQQSLGLSVTSFCKEHNIPPGTFYYWQKRYRQHHSIATAAPGFIPIHISSDQGVSSKVPFAEIVFTNGTSLKLHEHVGADYLAAILF